MMTHHDLGGWGGVGWGHVDHGVLGGYRDQP